MRASGERERSCSPSSCSGEGEEERHEEAIKGNGLQIASSSSPLTSTLSLRRCTSHSHLLFKPHHPLLRKSLSYPQLTTNMAANGPYRALLLLLFMSLLTVCYAAGYIVVFNDEVTSDQVDKYVNEVKEGGQCLSLHIAFTTDPLSSLRIGGHIGQRFNGAILNGFSAAITDKTLQTFKSLQGDVIKYIGQLRLSVSILIL